MRRVVFIDRGQYGLWWKVWGGGGGEEAQRKWNGLQGQK